MVLSELEILMLLFIGWQASTLYRHWKDAQTIKLIINQNQKNEKNDFNISFITACCSRS